MQIFLVSPNQKPFSGFSVSSKETPYYSFPGPPSPCCPLWSHVGSLPGLCPHASGILEYPQFPLHVKLLAHAIFAAFPGLTPSHLSGLGLVTTS